MTQPPRYQIKLGRALAAEPGRVACRSLARALSDWGIPGCERLSIAATMGVVKLAVKRAKLEVKALIPSAAQTWQVPAAEIRVDTRVLPHASGPACGIWRFTMLVQLPQGRTAESVRVALTEHIQRLPEALGRTLTRDQGKEMAEHVRFTIDSNVQVYFCDPSSPWQRGTSENTNGLLRQSSSKEMTSAVTTRQTLTVSLTS